MKLSHVRTLVLTAMLAGLIGIGLTRAQETKKEAKQALVPQVAGAWTGDWGMYSPPSKTGEIPEEVKKHMYPDACKKMDSTVERLRDGKWQATFEGECGRPYKYTIKMQGRQAGDVVMFQGSADLGEKDGGVFDWIGRASGSEFVGFFTSKGYTGTFRLARK
jgi:hypothetical protein